MKISGFTIARNAVRYNYPIRESILSILPICDEFIVNVGDSEDKTLDLIQSIDSRKIRIIRYKWNFSDGKEVLSKQTNLALAACTGDWAFYLQSDEVVHERDLPRLKFLLKQNLSEENIDCLRFQWFHFYGSYFRYRIDQGWYQKQDRIIRNNGTIESYGDAFGFRRRDNKELTRINTGCFIYHYGWVHPRSVMEERIANAQKIGFASDFDRGKIENYSYGDLNRFPAYFGTHPSVMKDLIARHALSQKDWEEISCRYWWFPPRIFKMRFKTGLRVKERIQ